MMVTARSLHACARSASNGTKKMQTLAGIGVDDGEQRGIGEVEIRLVERDLCGVLRKCFLEPVALDRAPVFGVERLVLPQERIVEIGAASGFGPAMMMPSAWPRRRPLTAENASTSGGANLKPAAIRCWRATSSK